MEQNFFFYSEYFFLNVFYTEPYGRLEVFITLANIGVREKRQPNFFTNLECIQQWWKHDGVHRQ